MFDRFALLGLPTDLHASFSSGCAEAPAAYRDYLKRASLNGTSETGVDVKTHPAWSDAGDVLAADMKQDFVASIEQRCLGLLQAGTGVLAVGGDHSVSFPILKAYAQLGEPLTVLHFDAHPDLYDEFKGDRLANACPFARVMEAGLVKRLIQVGIRTMNVHQREQAARFGVEVIEMARLSDAADLSFDSPVYVSLDMDALDPAYAPGVSHREPGGLSTREVIALIHNINQPLIGADIVEYNPRFDIDELTVNVLAKLIKELAGKMLRTGLRK